jgi:hypothetical protein
VDNDLPPPIEGPARAACTVKDSKTWRPLSLRHRPGAEPAVDVRPKVRATLEFPPGHALEGVFAQVAGDFGSAAGWLNADDVTLFAAQPTVFVGYAIPSANTKLQHRRVGAGKLQMTFEPDDHLKPIRPLVRDVACEKLRLSPADFEQKSPLDPAPLYWGKLNVGSVSLSETSGGKAVAEIIVTSSGPRFVSVHAADGARVRIAHFSYGQLAFGWVSLASLTRLHVDPDVGFGWGGGFGSVGSSGRGHWITKACDHEVPVILATEGEDLVTIGTLAANVAFKTVVRDPEDNDPFNTMMLIERRALRAIGGSSLRVPWESVASCPPPKN